MKAAQQQLKRCLGGRIIIALETMSSRAHVDKLLLTSRKSSFDLRYTMKKFEPKLTTVDNSDGKEFAKFPLHRFKLKYITCDQYKPK